MEKQAQNGNYNKITYTLERNIGEHFIVHTPYIKGLIGLEVIKSNLSDDICDNNCYFNDVGQCQKNDYFNYKIGPCSALDRIDGNSVYFKATIK